MHRVFRWFSKLIAAFVLLCSVSALADTNIYTCDLDAKNARGWIPSYLVISFLNSGQTAEINYGHKSKNIKVVRYSDRFKEITALTPMKSTNGKTTGTKHNITIFKNRDVTYVFQHTGASGQLIARGKCTAKHVKLSVPSPTKISVNSSQSASVATCGSDIATCTKDFICRRGVALIAGKKTWHKSNHAFYKYTVEAKKRGLSCGVVSSSSTAKTYSVCSSKNINTCSNYVVCFRGSRLVNRGGHYLDRAGTRIWDERPNWRKYAFEAQQRGLSCGVVSSVSVAPKTKPKTKPKTYSVCSSTNVTACSNDLLCSRGSRSINGKRTWDERAYWRKYAFEAQQRGLSCGVASSSSTPIVETKVPKVAPSAVPKRKPQTPIKSSPSLIDPLHIKNYGKTYHTALLPKVIFFIGEIEDGDEQGFRRALRSHDVDTVVLLSGGGLIYNGLELANIIFDNNLTTYIPAGKTCASACSFMFFAGNPKVAHGRLGVHQFYVEDDKKKIEVGKVQKGTQLLVADIIRNLTDFGTPPSVFSKMFSTSGMYFFSEKEKRAFSDSNKIGTETVTRINEVLSYFIKDIEDELNDVVLNGMPQGVKSSLIQLELLRIGCMQGPVDGIKGEATTAAIQLLSSKRGSNLTALKFSDLFRSLNNTKQGACY